MNKNRIILATIVSPLVLSLIITFLPALLTLSWPNSTDYTIVFFTSLVFSNLGMLIFGLPIVYFLTKLKRLTTPYLVFLGSISGGVVFCVFGLALGKVLESSSSITIQSILTGAIFGFIIAVTFGLISGITNRSSLLRSLRSLHGTPRNSNVSSQKY